MIVDLHGHFIYQGFGMSDMSNLSHFPDDKLDISIYLYWGKEFIALAKKSIQIMRYICFLFSRRKHMLWVLIRGVSVRRFQ